MPTVNKIKRPWQIKTKQKEHDKFYDSQAWRKLRALVLNLRPLCFYCYEHERYTPATIGDHYRPKRLYPDLALVIENIKPCCSQCHQSKRAWERTIHSVNQFESEQKQWNNMKK